MSFNSKQYLAHEERRLEPDSRLVKGYRRNRETSMASRNRYFEQLTDADRDRMRREYENEQSKLNFRS